MSSIFLSHNYKDKKFVRKLAEDLKRAGIRVWLDEAEIKVGDSLLEKIAKAINEMDYLGVILSKNSANSEWVKKEVHIALTDEISGKTVKVLPLLLESCSISAILKDKMYADFSVVDNYTNALQLLLDRLVLDKALNAKSIIRNSKLLDEAEQLKQKILIIWGDKGLMESAIGADMEPTLSYLMRIKFICKKVLSCTVYKEMIDFLLKELKSKSRSFDTAGLVWSICPDHEVDEYIIKNFFDLNNSAKDFLMQCIVEDYHPEYFSLIKKLLKMDYLSPDRLDWVKKIYGEEILMKVARNNLPSKSQKRKKVVPRFGGEIETICLSKNDYHTCINSPKMISSWS